MVVVDTNIILHAINRDSPLHSRCRELIDDLRGSSAAWFATWSIAYEFLRVSTHPRVFGRPLEVGEAWQVVERLFESRGFSMLVATDRHGAVARQTFSQLPRLSGNLLHDAHIAILMREHGIRRIWTADGGFRRFPFVEVLDPTAPAA